MHSEAGDCARGLSEKTSKDGEERGDVGRGVGAREERKERSESARGRNVREGRQEES